jgi:HTH-type transcriptional repressor of NAD biosynthesis genes
MSRATRGMVLGKFLPPHVGHMHLVEFARGFVDEVDVVVGTLAQEPIPGALRFAWMKELFPWARVLHLDDELPQEPSEDPRFWELWRESLLRVLEGQRPDYVFASEAYGHRLAEELGARFIPVDPARSAVSVSATQIRADPRAHWEQIPRCVRPYFVRRVCVFGPESTGKSTLTQRLAERFETSFVPEYARTWITAFDRDPALEDMLRIARGQVASEDALARNARGLLFCDTDPLLTTLWSEALFGQVDPALHALASQRSYDLYLLTDVDVPWVADRVRYFPEERRSFFEGCRGALEKAGRRYVLIDGDFDAREEKAVRAVEQLLAEGILGVSSV